MIKVARIVPHHQRDWQADAEQVNDQLRPSHRGPEGDWCVQIQTANPRQEQRRPEVIDYKNSKSIKQSHENDPRKLLGQRKKLGKHIENGRHRQRHREMHHQAERCCRGPAFISAPSQQPSGDALQ